MLILLILFLNLSIFSDAAEQNDWKKSMQKNGITIFTRSTESSKFKEFLAKAQFKGSIDEFRQIILDVDSYNEWMPDCKSAEVVSHEGADGITYHMKLKVPFPFENRDVVQQLILHDTLNALEIEIVSRPDDVEEKKKYVRMIDGCGKWLIKETADDEISIQFQYYANPGGDIPAWLVNSFIVKNPHMMLERIRQKMAD